MASQEIPRDPFNGQEFNSTYPRTEDPGESPVCFSFQFWKQIENFGLSTSDPPWFVSLLDSLKNSCSLYRSELEKDTRLRKRYHYHTVNWEHRNVPYQRDDLDWLPNPILENQEEFPIFQFSITLSKGRVWGFWDGNQENLFHIILLDPEHNLQPSRKYNYRIDPCHIVENEFADLRRRSDYLVNKVLDHCEGCEASEIAEEFKGHKQDRILISFESEYYGEIMKLIENDKYWTSSIDDIVMSGVLKVQEEQE